MDKVFLVFSLLFLLLLFLSLTTVRVGLIYALRGGENRFALRFSVWRGLIKYRYNLTGITLKKIKRRPQIKIHQKYIFTLLKKTRLRRLSWHTDIGAGDPAYTGLLTGAVWALKGLLITVFCRLLAPGGAAPVLEVRPFYHQVCLYTAIECALEIKLGHLVLTGIKVLPGLVAGRKKARN